MPPIFIESFFIVRVRLILARPRAAESRRSARGGREFKTKEYSSPLSQQVRLWGHGLTTP